MNTRPFLASQPLRLLLALLLASASAAQAQMTMSQINQAVWANLYGVTPAEYNSSTWLAEDSDGDGISNGAEMAAGTDPFSAGSTIQITSMSVSAGNLSVTFPTITGKQYILESNTTLSNSSGWAQVGGTSPVSGSNAPATITAAYAANTFYRVLVQDVSTTNDGMSDWAALKLGLNPGNSQSNGTTNTYGQYLADNVFVSNQLAAQNQVTITASDAYATEPSAGTTATDSAQFTLSRGGMSAMIGAITVSVTIGGNAVSGTDYSPLSTTVIFPAGIRSVNVPVTPLSNASLKSPATVTMTVSPGTGYTVGAANVAGVLIYPQGLVNGTGLSGNYYNYSSTPYSAAQNFFGSPVVANELDAGINFLWNTKNANSLYAPAGGGTAGTSISQSNYSIRWTGQVQPQYTETYTFEVDARDGVLLRIGGQTVINSWSDPGGVNTGTSSSNGIAAGTGVRTGTFAAQAGVRYDIQLDYYTLNGNLSTVNANTAPQIALSWYSYDQPKQLVPSTRLYPTTADSNAAPPSITSSLSAVGYLNQPFTYNVATGSNSASTVVSIQSGSLPPGLTFSQQTLSSGVTGLPGVIVGQISGTPTVAGNYQMTVQASNAAGASASVLTIQIIDTGSGITSEVWTGLTATSANVLNIPTTTTPNLTGTLGSLEDNSTSYGTNFGERLQGYITVNQTGNYYFWLAANDSAELYISDSAELGAKVRRAWVTPGGTTSRQWSAQASQQSGWIALTAGQKYYVEVLHQTINGGSNNLAVGFTLDPTGVSGPIANGSGVVPGYMLWQYYPAPVTYASQSASSGTLYYTQMGPEDGAITNGSGLATLTLNSAGTQATLSYNYDGLTTPLTQHHLHNDDYIDGSGVDHPSSIIFDLDAATPTGTNQYTWNIAATGTFTNVNDLVNVIRQGKCYLNLHTVNYPNGEIRGNFTLANGAQTFVAPAPLAYTAPATPSTTDAARFLAQASFGPTAADLTYITTNQGSQSNGFRSWIENQFTVPSTHLENYVQKLYNNPPDPYLDTMSANAWWQCAVTGPDQLRQRTAFALSEILVISSIGALYNQAQTLSGYYDLLLDDSFTNFQTILKGVTLHPGMGVYLNMQGNAAGSLITGVHANENYAREVHQLFSIGLYRLWPDGTVVLDSNFNLIPTYNQTFIQNVTPVFTGWNYYQANQGSGRLPTNFSPASDLIHPMVLVPTYHDLGVKQVLDNVNLPAAVYTSSGTTQTVTSTMGPQGGAFSGPYIGMNAFDANGLMDLDAALSSIFYHPNLGPFLCRQLIQRLVTSNPSPGYVYRVVQAFEGKGNVDGVVTGVRGDMKDTLRAILMDYEARSDNMLTSTTFGKQREPLLRVTTPLRYFLPSSSGGATYSQPASAAFPGRMTITPAAAIPNLSVGDNVNLTFGQHGSYTQNNGSGAAGTIITVSATNHGLSTGNSVYLKFDAPLVSSGTAPLDGLYTVQTVPNSGSFTVTAASSALILASDVIYDLMTTGTQSPGIPPVDPGSIFSVLAVTPSSGPVTSFQVQAYGQYQGTYARSGTTVTVTANSHGLLAGGGVYLTYAAGTGGTATSGVYTVLASPAPTSNTFAVTDPSSGSISGSPGVVLNRIPGSGIQVSVDDTGPVTCTTPIPHGLSTGQYVSIVGSGLTGNASYQVTSVTSPTVFVIANTGTLGSQYTGGMLFFPQVAPQTTRSGNLTFSSSRWDLGRSDGSENSSASPFQEPIRPQSVFSFFYPSYTYPGTLAYNGVTVPEFQLTSAANTMALTNFLEQAIFTGTTGNYTNGLASFRAGGESMIMDMSSLMTYFTAQGGLTSTTNAGVTAVITKLNNELMAGNMASGMQTQLLAYVTYSNFPSSSTQARDVVRAIVHLILISPEFAIQK